MDDTSQRHARGGGGRCRSFYSRPVCDRIQTTHEIESIYNNYYDTVDNSNNNNSNNNNDNDDDNDNNDYDIITTDSVTSSIRVIESVLPQFIMIIIISMVTSSSSLLSSCTRYNTQSPKRKNSAFRAFVRHRTHVTQNNNNDNCNHMSIHVQQDFFYSIRKRGDDPFLAWAYGIEVRPRIN